MSLSAAKFRAAPYAQRIALLGETTITDPVTGVTTTPVTDLEGLRELIAQCIFTYGSGGTTADFYLQTSFDGGTTWTDIASFNAPFSDAPADLGSDGSTPTGTAPLIYAPDGDPSDNQATGGDFTENGSPSSITGPAADSLAMDLDGSSDYYSKGSDLTGNADGKTGILSVWLRIDGDAGAVRYIMYSTNQKVAPQISAANKIRIYLRGAVGDQVNVYSTTTYGVSSTWLHLLSSWDTTNNEFHMYVNDVDVADTPVTLQDIENIDYTQPSWFVGSHSDASGKFNGAISELYFAPNQYLDFAVESNRRKFITTLASETQFQAMKSEIAVAANQSVQDEALSGILDGVIGDRIRVKYSTVGTFAGGTTVKIDAMVRG